MKVANIETEKSNAVAVLQMALSPVLRLVCNFFCHHFLMILIVMIWFAVQSNNEYRQA
jgi:hypothetical protein